MVLSFLRRVVLVGNILLSNLFYRIGLAMNIGLFWPHCIGIIHKVCRNGVVRRVIWLEMYCILELI
jgi:hypothetical protein